MNIDSTTIFILLVIIVLTQGLFLTEKIVLYVIKQLPENKKHAIHKQEYKYKDPAYDGKVVTCITGEAIIRLMRKHNEFKHLSDKECIDEFVATHWAEKVKK